LKFFKLKIPNVLIFSLLLAVLIFSLISGFSCSGKNNNIAAEESRPAKQEETASSINGTSASEATSTSIQPEPVNEAISVGVDEVLAMLEETGKYFLLDVRSKEEYDAGHIDSATLIPVTEIEKRISEIPAGKPIIVYCLSGIRSLRAAGILVKNNFSPVYNMAGGLTEWDKKGYPVVK
jgi:rhodanese-related sulfurtransferase